MEEFHDITHQMLRKEEMKPEQCCVKDWDRPKSSTFYALNIMKCQNQFNQTVNYFLKVIDVGIFTFNHKLESILYQKTVFYICIVYTQLVFIALPYFLIDDDKHCFFTLQDLCINLFYFRHFCPQ